MIVKFLLKQVKCKSANPIYKQHYFVLRTLTGLLCMGSITVNDENNEVYDMSRSIPISSFLIWKFLNFAIESYMMLSGKMKFTEVETVISEGKKEKLLCTRSIYNER